MGTTKHWFLKALLLASVGLSASFARAQQVTVGISGTGAVRFTDASALTCDAASEGSIRYVDASNRVEFCDDTVWTVLGPGGVGTIYINDLADAVTDYVTGHNMRLGSNTAMFAGATGNVFVGDSAGAAGSSGAVDDNVGIGYQSLDSLTTGAGNIAVGSSTLTANASGTSNTVVGDYAMADNTWGTNNTAIGSIAMWHNDGGGENVAVGGSAMRDSTADDKSTMVGYGAGSNGAQSNAVGIGHTALSQASADNNIAIGYQAGNGITSGASNIVIGYDVDAMSATGSSQLNIGDTIYGDLANDRIRVGGTGTVAAGPLYAVPPAAQTVAGTNTITADACGTIKQINAASSVTTNTSNTFTASTPAGCCMTVINVDTADTVTLDANAAFKTAGGTDQALGPYDSVEVCSDGTTWYQTSAVVAAQ